MIVSHPPKPESSLKVALSIVVPVYKEAGNIRPFLTRSEAVMARMGTSYEIIFALDPSPDDTEAVILGEIDRNPAVKLILFSRRFGQPAATMAGILNCTGEKCVVIDVDLQDQPEVIEQLYNKMAEGYEVVYAMRSSREEPAGLIRLFCRVRGPSRLGIDPRATKTASSFRSNPFTGHVLVPSLVANGLPTR